MIVVLFTYVFLKTKTSPLPLLLNILGMSIGYSTYADASSRLGDYDIERKAKSEGEKTWQYGSMGEHSHSSRWWTKGKAGIQLDAEHFNSAGSGIIDFFRIYGWQHEIGRCWGKPCMPLSPLDKLTTAMTEKQVTKLISPFIKGWTLNENVQRRTIVSILYNREEIITVNKQRRRYKFSIWCGFFQSRLSSVIVEAGFDSVH